MEILKKALQDEALLLGLEADSLDSALHSVLDLVVERGWLDTEHRDSVETALLERERQISTAIGHGVAVPHAYLDCFEHQVVVVVRLKEALDLNAPDGYGVRFLFVLMGPTGTAAAHLDTLTVIARLLSDEQFRYDAADAEDRDEMFAAVERFEERSVPGAVVSKREVPEGMRYTGKMFGGIVADIKRRAKHYASDFKDGLHPKCLSSVLFLFFACMAPAVTFGGVMAGLTGGAIGPVEMILATAVGGIIYALFAGQPLTVLNGTGPLLIFTAILYDSCQVLEIAFMPTYFWVGLWSAAFLVLLAAFDASCLMRFFTRFTDEIFAALISLIFIVTALQKLATPFQAARAKATIEQSQQAELRQTDPTTLNQAKQIITDLWSIIDHNMLYAQAVLGLLLALGTLYIAHTLSRSRRSRYLSQTAREFLADFGPTIALAIMAGVAFWLRDIKLPPLEAPDTFGPTQEGRSWILSLGGVPGWVPFAAAIPALLVSILIFINQNITTRLVNNPDHKLHKGDAYHAGLALVGVLVGICSMFGLPWLVASIVPSLNHVRSLATSEDVEAPGGGTRERIVHTRENRLTGLGIHLLMGLSLFFLPLLGKIPMAVLYGLFLYMGIVSIGGNQFFERLSLWAMDRSHYPSTHYIRKVPTKTIHLFTLLQLICLAVLGVINISPPQIAILFPLFLVGLVFVRLYADRFFAPSHLAALDAQEEPEEEQTMWSV